MRLSRVTLLATILFLIVGCQTAPQPKDQSTPPATPTTSQPVSTQSSPPPTASPAPTADKQISIETASPSSQALQCKPCAVAPAPKAPSKTQKLPGDKTIIGEVELAHVSPGNFTTKARIDTGATTTSIHAWDTVEFERDGKKWVKFKVLGENGQGSQTLERRITRIASIKRHGAEDVKRFAVMVTMTIGKVSERIEVTLADREAFDYKVLVGRNLLTDIFVVDVSKKLAAGKPVPAGK
ncbi:ATP-dependent zinc protease [Aestuariirhabdus sp. Z084]|uniref:ATP-dependent zinc protease family protein n=1 Tax=Aestuariirhabdus haliotis TaxID=2918751 RepID=UPI00201B3742|nr:ATP-dependent zinc protease [Aestuariirhabdus haliotis]MCL6416461.1 ATP-dependent zinc protease [Aestuariirhabdus haliotis]MCL6420451.1 ATP-dependent zinc protease [Aestuariirhabdus haliotis]